MKALSIGAKFVKGAAQAWSFAKRPGQHIMASGMRNIKTVGKVLSGASTHNTLRDPRQLKQLATASLKLYGGYTAATYGSRMLKGQSLYRNKKGRVDIAPGLPIL